MSVDIKYELSGVGWCDCTITVDTQSAFITGAYLTDVLPQFCDAAIDLLGSAERVQIAFEEEPGEYRWIITSVSAERANLKIYSLYSFGSELSSEGTKLILDAAVGKVELARALHRAMSDVLTEHGKDGYLEKWDMAPFPSEKFANLASALLAANHSL